MQDCHNTLDPLKALRHLSTAAIYKQIPGSRFGVTHELQFPSRYSVFVFVVVVVVIVGVVVVVVDDWCRILFRDRLQKTGYF